MLNVENNYPIRYALKEIYIATGIDCYGDKSFEIAYYLPIPCYLLSERKIYKANGTTDMEYEVVFTRNIKGPRNGQNKNEEEFPEFNYNGSCINANTVRQIFNAYQEAKEEAIQQNLDYFVEKNCLLSKIDFLAKLLEFQATLESMYEYIEQEILVESQQKVLKKC